LIQIRLKDGWSANKIAKEIGCAPNTIRNEIRRGTVSLYRGNVMRYETKVGQATYQQNRLACGRHLDNLEKAAFLDYVDSHIKEDKWSLDACVGRALQSGKFVRCELVYTKTT
jgi:transposase (fragment)